jgi:hypothetical protein
MAHAYTPGLRVAERALIRKRRMLPIRGTVLVRPGERVTAQQVVAGTELPGNVQLVNIAYHLGIEPADVAARMRVQAGDAVTKGQLLAENVGLFGLFRTDVPSPSDGTVESVSKVTGQLLLREPPRPLEVNAYIAGTVSEVYESEGVEVATEGTFIQGILGVGGERQGRIRMVATSPDQVLLPADIGPECAGMVVIGGRCADLAVYRRAEEVGAVGLVVGSFSDADLGRILGYDLGIAITGGEEHLRTTLVLTEGFGELSMAGKTFELLGRLDGSEASICGATQIRAGVIRPEIIVSREAGAQAVPAAATETRVGARVRIIRQPHFGAIARIRALPSESVTIESGAVVRVMEVELPGGTAHTLPRANVELIEE